MTVRLRAKNNIGLGAEAARCAGPRVRSTVNVLARWARHSPTALEEFMRRARAHERFLEKADPTRLAELEGLARGLAMSPGDLFRAGFLAESIVTPQCTNFGAVPPATRGDDVIVSWNFDVPPYFRLMLGRFPLYVRDIDGTIPHVCLGVPALFGIGILNAEGLSCVVNAVGVTDDGEGFTQFELNNKAMETCSTVDGAAEVFEAGPRKAVKSMTTGILLNWNTIWVDKGADLSLFENSHHHFHRQRAGGDGLMASGNHHQFLDRGLTGSVDPTMQELIAGSYSRLARMWALLRKNHGSIEPITVKAIVSDHIPDYSLLKEFGIDREWWVEMVDDATICGHAWNLGKHLRAGEIEGAFMEMSFSTTVYSLQVHPKTMTVWFTNGHPCRNIARPLYWGDMLSAPVEQKPMALCAEAVYGAKCVRGRQGVFRRGMVPWESALDRVWMGVTRAMEKPNFKKREGR